METRMERNASFTTSTLGIGSTSLHESRRCFSER